MSATAFDLIPATYRQRLQTRRQLRLFGFVAVAAIGLCVGSAGVLAWTTNGLNSDITQLEQRQSLSRQQEAQLADMNASLAELQRRWHLLEGLRSGMPAAAVMAAVENALPVDEVWFTDWRFLRAGIVTEKQTDPRPPSYFIRLESAEPIDQWQALTHMKISGQATDHEALSKFARSLLKQPGVADVAVQRTSTARSRDSQHQPINFELAVHIRAVVTNT